MAVGFQFLAKTSSLQRNNNVSHVAARNNNSNTNSVQNQKTSNAQKTDMASMSTSDLIKDVYNNQPNVNIQDNTGEDETKPDEVKLPLTVEYNNCQFSTHGKKFEDLVKEISKKTHDSTCKVESELKRKYTTVTGGSINMNA